MWIEEWIKTRSGMKKKDFADLVGLDQPRLWRIINRKEEISKAKAIKIYEVTNGEVSLEEMLLPNMEKSK